MASTAILKKPRFAATRGQRSEQGPRRPSARAAPSRRPRSSRQVRPLRGDKSRGEIHPKNNSAHRVRSVGTTG